jgi:general secretion pathway protein B
VSYILDALKKSEKERQRGTAPDLLTVQEPVLREKKKRRVWPYIIFTVLILGVGLAAYRLIPWQSKNENAVTNDVALQKTKPKPSESLQPEVSQTITTQAGIEKREVPPPTNTTVEKSLKTPPAITKKEEKPVVQKVTVQSKIQEQSAVKKAAQPVQTSQQALKPEIPASASSVVSPDVKPVQHDPAPVPGKIYHSGDLPASVQQNLPAVTMSIFMYSEDPASRMVRINGQTLREGQYISEGLKVEEIKPDGVILNYKNYRLHIGQKQ